MARIAVIGIGNVLTGDDALGPWVVRAFEAQWQVPEDVEVIDAGTPGLDLTAYLMGLEAVVVVDVVKSKGQPGELRLYDKAGILNRGPIVAMSPHEPGLRESILHAELQGVSPPVIRLVGVIPGSVEYGLGLTPEVQAAVPKAIEQVKVELEALGVAVTRRDPPAQPDLWWTKPQHG